MTSRFIEQALTRAGLGEILPARKAGDLAKVRALLPRAEEIDLLVLGALADAIRAEECGAVVRVHENLGGGAADSTERDVRWLRAATSELDLLRRIAVCRITSPAGTRIGVDWGRHGLELSQVALGFGATDLTGPIQRKAGSLISEDELKKVKGQGMVQQASLKRREIAALVRNAGREPELVDEARPTTMEASANA